MRKSSRDNVASDWSRENPGRTINKMNCEQDNEKRQEREGPTIEGPERRQRHNGGGLSPVSGAD